MTWVMNPHTPLASGKANDHDEPGTEIASGVFVERRSILWLPALAAATFLFGRSRLYAADDSKGGATRTAKEPSSTGPLDWDEFLKQCVPIAKEIILAGVLSIQAGNNPRVVEMQLLSFLSTKQQAAIPKAA